MAFVIDGNDKFNTRYVNNTPFPTDRGDNAGNENDWAWAVLNRCGVGLLGFNPIQGNTPFQHQDRFAFSPLPTNPLSIEGLALVILIKEFSKTDKGQERLTKLADTYIKTCGSIIESVQDASHSNWLTALNNQHITAAIAHRIGLMDDASYIKIIDHYRSVFDKLFGVSVASTAIGGIADTLRGVSTLVQKSKTITGATGGLTKAAELASFGDKEL